MGENDRSYSGTKRPMWRGRLPAWAGIGAAAVAVLMMAAPGSGAVLHAPYKGGAYAPSNNIYTDGCGHAKVVKPWTFSLKTGMGGAVDFGSAVACKKSLAGVGTYSDSSVGGGFSLAIPVKVPSGNHSVSAALAYHMAGLLKANDGLLTANAPCNYGVVNSQSDYQDYEWGYYKTASGYYTFASYNDSSNYSNSQGYSQHYQYGTGPTPSPFNHNNTSASYIGKSASGYGACEASSSFDLYATANLVDLTHGGNLNMTGNTLQTCHTFFGYTYCDPVAEVYVDVVNVTDWYCSSYTDWYGPTNVSSSSPWTCSSYNKTLTSTVTIYYPTSLASSTVGTSNSVNLTLPASGSGSIYWNDTYNTRHHYVLDVNVQAYASAYDTWKKGSASWTLNIGTLGNGIALTSVSVV